ncbi:hypothetical protein J2W49_000519 [Hydrogenophaga palleronii]|uniref:Transmembrane protein n=1 Tax=Hydrogenophaga palleronii TaxID=65655 RepID=A0ABU1WHP6_9BURK|nr:hypothetical protein [Hydrogenophaga palleronii]MDR7148591.1 hypothetical protein [Hydrogenophaga palleronii]
MFAALGAHPWAYPMLEVAHILGIALILGNLVLLEMRVFGWATDLPMDSLARLSLALVGIGFSVAAASGLLMFATQAEELLANRAFTAKMLLLILAACNAAWFHGRRSLQRLDGGAKVLMVVSTVTWLLVVTCGRWIAYV